MAGHERLRAHLNAQRKILSSAQWIEELGDGLQRDFISQDVPVSFKMTVGALTQVRETTGGYTVGMGPEDLVGRAASDGDMRGTIARFLNDFPRFKRRFKKLVTRPGRVFAYNTVTEEIIADPSQSWWNLPLAGKRKLQEERESGRYGGAKAAAASMVPYFFGHDQSKEKWQASGEAAGIKIAQKWVASAVDEWRHGTREDVVTRLIRNLFSA